RHQRARAHDRVEGRASLAAFAAQQAFGQKGGAPMMARASLYRRLLPGGRLHLQEGPIDLVIEAFGAPAEVRRAYDAASACFTAVLPGLVAELPALKRAVTATPSAFTGPVARRMQAACAPHRGVFVTPMAAVAGAVADHVLAAMTQVAELARAY